MVVPQAAPSTVVFRWWASSKKATKGRMALRLQNGEEYVGTYIHMTSASRTMTLDPYSTGWSPGWSEWNNPAMGPSYTGGAVVRKYSGQVRAVLRSQRGHWMQCRFRLADPTAGMKGGAIGQCALDGGGVIEGITTLDD